MARTIQLSKKTVRRPLASRTTQSAANNSNPESDSDADAPSPIGTLITENGLDDAESDPGDGKRKIVNKNASRTRSQNFHQNSNGAATSKTTSTTKTASTTTTFTTNTIPTTNGTQESENESDGSSEYEFVAEKILWKRFYKLDAKKKKAIYLVKWVDYDDSENTWEPAERVNNSKMVEEFERKWELWNAMPKRQPKRVQAVSRTNAGAIYYLVKWHGHNSADWIAADQCKRLFPDVGFFANIHLIFFKN